MQINEAVQLGLGYGWGIRKGQLGESGPEDPVVVHFAMAFFMAWQKCNNGELDHVPPVDVAWDNWVASGQTSVLSAAERGSGG